VASKEKLLAQLGEVRADAQRLRQRRARLIEQARAKGIPVPEIAKALGISRQAVYKSNSE
jgi:hypothetical protein